MRLSWALSLHQYGTQQFSSWTLLYEESGSGRLIFSVGAYEGWA